MVLVTVGCSATEGREVHVNWQPVVNVIGKGSGDLT